MAFNHTLSGILRGRWLLDKQWAQSQLPMVLLMLQGKINLQTSSVTPDKHDKSVKSEVARSGDMGTEQPFAIDPATMTQYPLYKFDYGTWSYVPNPNIPQGSVGILPISGPITKYNGDCGEPGSIQRAGWLQEMQSRSNIGSIIQLIDTPGGESRAANSHVQAIQKSNKPVLSYIDGMCASLGVWYSSASQETYLSSEMDEMGSIGSYCSILDFSGYLEAQGIKLIEIYAPQSIDKNKDYRDAMNGDTSAIEADLKIMVDAFTSFVKTSRGDKASSNAKAWDSGKMFYANEAVKLGLADGIKPFDQVVSKAAWLGKRNKN